MRVDGVGRGDRAEVAAALVHDELDPRERLEPAAEARLRAPDALCDGADPPTILRIQVKHAVGLAEADRAKHDSFRLERAASGHS